MDLVFLGHLITRKNPRLAGVPCSGDAPRARLSSGFPAGLWAAVRLRGAEINAHRGGAF